MKYNTYECDTCNRTINKKVNKKGLDVIGRCIITDGCKGKLSLLVNKQISDTFNPNVTDYIPRKKLHNHTQQLPRSVWTIKHELSNNPIVQTFVYNDERVLEEITPTTITYKTKNEIQVTFPRDYYGIAQCIVRSNTSDQTVSTVEEMPESVVSDYIQLSVDTQIVFATILTSPTLYWTFVSPTSGKETTIITESDNTNDTPWEDVDQLTIKGVRYNVYSVNLQSTVIAGLESGSLGRLHDNGVVFGKNECLLLLTNSPFDVIDKRLNNYCVVAGEQSLRVNGVEIEISTNTLKNIFPAIKISN